MSKTAMTVLAGAVLALGLGVVVASAEPPALRGEWGPWAGMIRVLGLSEQQQGQVRTLIDERRAEHEALRELIEANHEDLRALLEGAQPDPAAVGDLAIEGQRLRAEAKALREAQDKAIRAVLTADQQAKFDAISAMREEGRGGPAPGGGPRRWQP